jgi:hypothetical protein
MSCIDIWTIVYPYDPNALALGSDKNNVTIISLSPPEDNNYITAYKDTVCSDLDEEITIGQPTGDLNFESDEDNWIASNPSSIDVVNINIPVTINESPEIIPISFTFNPLKINQNIGDVFIYASKGSSIFKIDSEGNTIKEIITNNTVSKIEKTALGTVVWYDTSGDVYKLENDTPVKIDNIGNISGFGTGLNDKIFIFDDYELSTSEIGNNYLRLYNSEESNRKLRPKDSVSYGVFKFNSNGSFIHGSSIDPTATTGYDFAVITYYNNRITNWRKIINDWEYEDKSREKIVNAAFDSNNNCYCVTEAWTDSTPLITCDAFPTGSECGGNYYYPETFSSLYSVQTLENSSWAESGNCSNIYLTNMEPFTKVKITDIVLWGRDSGGSPIGPVNTNIATDWESNSSGLSYDTDGWVFTCYGPGHYVILEQTDPVNVCYRINAMQLTFEFGVFGGGG